MTKWLHFHFSLSLVWEGNGNPLQCSCLENPKDRGAWWTDVYGVTQSRTRLKWLSSSSSSRMTKIQRNDHSKCWYSFRKCHSYIEGMKNGRNFLEIKNENSYKATHSCIIWSSNHTLNLTQLTWKMHYTKLYMWMFIKTLFIIKISGSIQGILQQIIWWTNWGKSIKETLFFNFTNWELKPKKKWCV